MNIRLEIEKDGIQYAVIKEIDDETQLPWAIRYDILNTFNRVLRVVGVDEINNPLD